MSKCLLYNQVVGGRPGWIIIPVRDSGALVGDRIVGTPPGIKYALCVKRPDDRMNSSDVLRIIELHSSIEYCITYLRKRDIFKELRHRSMLKLKETLENMSKRADLDLQVMFNKLASTLVHCLPGAQVYTAVLNTDFNSITYSLFDSSFTSSGGESGENNAEKVTLWSGQGSDWTAVGRKASMVSLKNLSDIAAHGRKFACFKPFINCSFPRYTVPLQSGDVSLGLFGVENLDVYQGGLGDNGLKAFNTHSRRGTEYLLGESDNQTSLDSLSSTFGVSREMKELKDWLQSVAGMCGDVMYSAKEKHAINELDLYTQLTTSTPTGLMRRVLNACLGVLQGCRMVELWAVRKVAIDSRPPIQASRINTASAKEKDKQNSTDVHKSISSDDSTSDAESDANIRINNDSPDSYIKGLPMYNPDVAVPAEYDITSLAVQTPHPPPDPSRRLKFMDIKLVYNSAKKTVKKKLLMREDDQGNGIEISEKVNLGFGSMIKRRFSTTIEKNLGAPSNDNDDNVQTTEIDNDQGKEGGYISLNSPKQHVPTKYILGIENCGIEFCYLLNCAADVPDAVEAVMMERTRSPNKVKIRKVQSRKEMLSSKAFDSDMEVKTNKKKNAYLMINDLSREKAAAAANAEQRKKEYKRMEERKKLLCNTYLCEDTTVVLGNDRDFKIVVYELTEDMTIINEFRGFFQLLTFKEENFKCKLVPERIIVENIQVLLLQLF